MSCVNGIAICCTASIANRQAKSFDPFADRDDCHEILLVVDEAHHSESKVTAKVIDSFIAKGGRVMYVTATPFNANGVLKAVKDPCFEVIHRSLAEHMNAGMCPKLEIDSLFINDGVTSQTSLANIDYADDTRVDAWAKAIADRYVKDECPKTLIIVPPTVSGREDVTTVSTTRHLIKALQCLLPGKTFLDCVGEDHGSHRISNAILAESKGKTDHDFIVACKRFDEGTDVKTICAVYNIGACNDRLAIQRLGRALRLKTGIPGFAKKHPTYVKRSKFVFFMFDMGLNGEAEKLGFAGQLLRVIAAVESFTSYELVSGIVRLRKVLSKEPGNDKTIEDLDRLEADVITSVIEKPKDTLAMYGHQGLGHTIADLDEGPLSDTLLLNAAIDTLGAEEFVKRLKSNGSGLRPELLQQLVKSFADNEIDITSSAAIDTLLSHLDGDTITRYNQMIKGNTETAQERVDAIIKYAVENGKYPTTGDSDRKIASLATILFALRCSRSGHNASPRWQECYQEQADAAGLHGIFMPQKQCHDVLARIREIAEYYHKYGHYPIKCDKSAVTFDPEFLSRLRQARNSKKSAWHDEYLELAIELGCPDMFDFARSSTTESAIMINKRRIRIVAEYYHKHGHYPRARDNRFVALMRASRKLHDKKWSDEYLTFAIELGCPDMFEPMKGEVK
jgi:hypothetical protein